MFKIGIQWLMILLIATQSVWSVADAHSAHQSDFDQVKFEYQHDNIQSQNTNSETDSSSTDHQSGFDCHHCSHCHHAHCSLITSFYSAITLFGKSPKHSFSNPLKLSQQPNAFFRPPKA